MVLESCFSFPNFISKITFLSWKEKAFTEEIPKGFVVLLLLLQLWDNFCSLLGELECRGKFTWWRIRRHRDQHFLPTDLTSWLSIPWKQSWLNFVSGFRTTRIQAPGGRQHVLVKTSWWPCFQKQKSWSEPNSAFIIHGIVHKLPTLPLLISVHLCRSRWWCFLTCCNKQRVLSLITAVLPSLCTKHKMQNKMTLWIVNASYSWQSCWGNSNCSVALPWYRPAFSSAKCESFNTPFTQRPVERMTCNVSSTIKCVWRIIIHKSNGNDVINGIFLI